MAAVVAGADFEAGFGYAEAFGEKFKAHLVGGVVHRRGGQLYFERPIVKPGNHIFR